MGIATVITSGKGGVGKSTLAVGLGRALAQRGRRVLLVDCDAGLRSLDRMTGVEEGPGFRHSRCGLCPLRPGGGHLPLRRDGGAFPAAGARLGGGHGPPRGDEEAGVPAQEVLRLRPAGLPRGGGHGFPGGGLRRGQGPGGLRGGPGKRPGGGHGAGAAPKAGCAGHAPGGQPFPGGPVLEDRRVPGPGRGDRRRGHPPFGGWCRRTSPWRPPF